MQVCLVRRRRDGGGLAFILEGVGIVMAKKSAFAKMEWNSLIYLDLSPINMKADNCSSGKKNGGKKKEQRALYFPKETKPPGIWCFLLRQHLDACPKALAMWREGRGRHMLHSTP